MAWFHSPTPDASTICRFRQALGQKNLYQRLLTEINGQPFDRLTAPSEVEGVIEVLAAEARGASIAEDSSVKGSYSDNVEATWTVIGKRPHSGYKVHVGTDIYQGFVLGGQVTAVHVSDSLELEPLVDELNLPEGALVLGDTGYVGRRNEAVLEAWGLKNGIMEKA